MISPIVNPDSYFLPTTRFSIHMDGVDSDYIRCAMYLIVKLKHYVACHFHGKRVIYVTFAHASLP